MVGIKVSNYLPAAQYPDALGIKIVDFIGDYLKLNILLMAAAPVGGVYVAINLPYANKIKSDVTSKVSALPKRTVDYGNGHIITYDDAQDAKNALADPTSGISRLIASIEATFTITQAAAIVQFNVVFLTPPPPVVGPWPPTGAPFSYVPNTFANAIKSSVGEIVPLLSTAFDAFVTNVYAANGVI